MKFAKNLLVEVSDNLTRRKIREAKSKCENARAARLHSISRYTSFDLW